MLSSGYTPTVAQNLLHPLELTCKPKLGKPLYAVPGLPIPAKVKAVDTGKAFGEALQGQEAVGRLLDMQ